jgi:hypothetical protein
MRKDYRSGAGAADERREELMTAPSVAKPSGDPDFVQPKKTVKGSPTKVPTSGTPDFEAGGGQKTVRSGGGDATTEKSYTTERKAQEGPDSYF